MGVSGAMDEEKTVLFVDDEVNILHSLERGLIDVEYNCVFVNSGRKALQYLEQNPVHVIVSDMRMPEMDGLTLLKIVKERWPNVTRIVLTGYAQLTQVAATVNQADIFQLIFKPWKMEKEFVHVIQAALHFNQMKVDREFYEKALLEKNRMYQKLLQKMQKKAEDTKENIGKRNLFLKTAFDLLIACNDAESTAEESRRRLQVSCAVLQELETVPLTEREVLTADELLLRLEAAVTSLTPVAARRSLQGMEADEKLFVNAELLCLVLRNAVLTLLCRRQIAELSCRLRKADGKEGAFAFELALPRAEGDVFDQTYLEPLCRELMRLAEGDFSYRQEKASHCFALECTSAKLPQ